MDYLFGNLFLVLGWCLVGFSILLYNGKPLKIICLYEVVTITLAVSLLLLFLVYTFYKIFTYL